jgi:DNA-binding Lrp family transcriptional regulator
MGSKVYILLDVIEGRLEQVVQTLRGKPGVAEVDLLDGSPNIIMVVEAPKRKKLAERTIQALASVETMTEGVQLLPTRDGCDTHVFDEASSYSKAQGHSGRRGGTRLGMLGLGYDWRKERDW